MIVTTTFDENPVNSPQNVRDVLEAHFNLENKEMPMPLSIVVDLLGVEVEECGGVRAMKISVEEFDRWRGERFPELKSQNPTLTEFRDYLFSPISNFPRIIQESDRPGTSQVVVLGAAGLTLDATREKILKIKLYTGLGWNADFPLLDEGSPPDLYVKLSIQGIPVDESKAKKTRVEKNSWTPSWGQEFEFRLRSPENASILFEVYDRDRFSRDDFAGKVSLPVSELRMGIRAVPLYDKEGKKCDAARFLVRFMIV
uniref:Phosphoinositide phospholipase C 8 n=1 Tax=Noccaea caerulescens TaxID=107243 RepID=A0A1J3GE33_NOCCA